MLLAIDFDRTFTLDPSLWGSFLRVARISGHRSIIVTCRSPRQDNYDEIREALMSLGVSEFVDEIICTGHAPKRAAAVAAGYLVDVWVDDVPEVIGAKDAAEVAEIEQRFGVRET